MDPNEQGEHEEWDEQEKNEEKEGIPLEDLLRQYLEKDLLRCIDDSDLYLREVEVRTNAGDVVKIRLTASTAKKVARLLLLITTSALGGIVWARTTEGKPPTQLYPESRTGCEHVKT